MTPRARGIALISILATGVAFVAAPATAVPEAPGTTHAPAAAPLLTVKTIAKFSPDQIEVSGNGRWVLVVSSSETPHADLFNALTGKQVGGDIDGPPGAATNELPSVAGVTDGGVVYGSALDGPSTDSSSVEHGFIDSGGTESWIPNPTATQTATWFGCGNQPVGNINVALHGVNPQGVAVGGMSAGCAPNEGVAVAYGSSDKWSPAGKSTHTATGYPSGAATIDEAGLIIGYEQQSGGVQSEWTTNSTAESLATLTGYPDASSIAEPGYSYGNDFIGSQMTAAGGLAVWEGHSAVDVPSTLSPQALGPKNEAVGSINSDGEAAVWLGGKSVTLLSTLVHKTSLVLVEALAIDRTGDIFGRAQTPTGNVLFEASVAAPKPTVSITTPKAGHAYKLHSTVKASFSCKAGSGTTLKSCVGTVGDKKKVNTSKAGTHAFTVTAKDADGQSTKKTVKYKVKS